MLNTAHSPSKESEMSGKIRNIALISPIISVFVWSLITHGENYAGSASNYPTAWAYDTTIVEQVRSVSPVAAELIDAEQKQIVKHAFRTDCDGYVNAAEPPEDRVPSRWNVKVSEEAVTFVINHPIPVNYLKPEFGVGEILVFYKDGQWMLDRDGTVLIRGRVKA